MESAMVRWRFHWLTSNYGWRSAACMKFIRAIGWFGVPGCLRHVRGQMRAKSIPEARIFGKTENPPTSGAVRVDLANSTYLCTSSLQGKKVFFSQKSLVCRHSQLEGEFAGAVVNPNTTLFVPTCNHGAGCF